MQERGIIHMCLMLRAEILPLETLKMLDFIIKCLISCNRNTKLVPNVLSISVITVDIMYVLLPFLKCVLKQDNVKYPCTIGGFQSCVDEHSSLLDYDTVQNDKQLPAFWRT